MTEANAFLAPNFSALSEVYEHAGLSDFSRRMTPQVLAYLQGRNWAGRRVLDLGCGTGGTTWWLAERALRVIGIDASAAMLAQAEVAPADTPLTFEPPRFVQADIRELESPIGPVDLILAVGSVLNYIPNLRDLERVFKRVHHALDQGRFFVFEMHTIRGLAGEQTAMDEVIFDDHQDVSIVRRSRFSFETLSRTDHYTIWQRHNATWKRADEIHLLRGFPTLGAIGLLERAGFTVLETLNTSFTPVDPAQDQAARVVIIAARN